MFYVYLLESGSQRYIGSTKDLKRRIEEHNSGQNQSTKAYRPWTLVFYEAYPESSDAIRREKYLKTNPGRQALSRMLRDYYSKKD
jgi:putative endonuclease